MKARFHRALALLLVLVLTLGCIPAVSAAQPDEPVANPEPAEEAAQMPEGSDLGAILQGSKDAELEALQPETPKDTDLVRVIVELDAPALTEQSGMFAGKALTDAGRAAQQNAIAAQEQVEAKIAEAAPEASVRYSYSLLLNGIALECAYGHIAELEALPGVKAVHMVQTYELPTEPKVTSGGGMIGAPTAWNLGMDGSGMVVAVLDTGLDTDHAAFAVDPKSPAVVRGDIDEILSADTLQAQRLVQNLSSDRVYLSSKVPYVFDYADHDTDVNHHGGSDHGTHVAGIVAANPADGSVTGVAPQAQLMILKVFPDGSTGANSDDILAALEDCVTLGVDVVNLSLGSPAGFTYRSDLLSTMEFYDRLAKAGIIVAAAAGNEYSAAYKNLWGTDLSLTSNPDYGIVGSPSSYSQTLSVASADNVTVRSAYFEAAGRKITFTDTATTSSPEGGFIRVLGGKTLDYVVVPGSGEEADYANLNVKGKVALVSRGVTTFAEKHEMARSKGAAACIVYNTEAGMINMSIDSFPIPAIFISQADGQAMVAAAKDGVGTLTVSNSTYDAPSETGGQPSSFSSWGSTSQLEITPDIMAPGGNIYSSRDNNSYGLMSGTSMATPHLAGASALMLEYLRTAGIEGDAMTLAYALMMSTAVPAKGSNGVTASPRKQGAGLVNLASAMATKAYLQVEGKERPKLELGDDPDKTGEYQMTFRVVNFGTEALQYAITPTVLPDSVELVESAAFNSCSTAKTLVLSQNLREIGARAFMGLKGISTLTIPDSVQKIGNSAFNGLSNLLELHLSAKTQEYGSGVFSSASKLPRVELPEGMTAVPEEMFSSCNALTEVVIPSTVTRIEKGAFRSCKKLGNTELPAGLTYIGESAFYYAAMTSVTLPAGVTEIGERSFYNIAALTEFNFSESLKTIGDFAFYGCGKLTRIVMPDSVESIGTSAFNRCSSLQEVVFGKGLASIGSMCFNYCHKLERFVVDETNPNFKGVDGVLYNKNVDTLVLYPQGRPDASFTMPETVKHIGPYGIYEPQLLQAVTVSPILETIDEFGMAGIALTGVVKLPATITSIHFKAFQYDDGVTAFELPESCAAYATVDGVLYDKAVTHLLVYPAGRPDVSYETPDTVRTVGSYAFHSCKYLENIRLTGVEKLEERAFSTAKALKHIDLANSVQLIDTYACANLSTLTYLTGTGALRAIGANAFSSTGLEFVTLPAIELLGQYAFSFCKDMKRCVIGSTVQSIYASAFNYCKGMHEAYFLGDRPDSVGANIFAKTASDFTIYYDAAKAATWAPSGEIKWGEYPIAPATFHAVRFLDVDHSILLEQPVAEGHAAMLPPEPQREEAAFTGWSADTSNVQQDMDVLALYDGLSDKLTVNVIAGENGTVDPLGETACFYDGELKLTIQPNEGYHTDRVLVNGEITACEDNTLTLEHIRSNTTVTVLFARNTYTVSLADGLTGNVFAALPVEYGEDAVLPEATPWHEGYHFTGWSADGRNITDDCTITANYEQNSYTVRFVDYDGTELSVQTVLHGEAAELPASPAREGYTFVGWSGDVSAVTCDMTVTALYAVKTCTVFFTDWDGTVLKTQEVNYGEAAEAPQAPSREGYTFTGWSGDYTNVTESRILMAQYERLSFTVRFVDYDGTELSSQSVFWGEAAAAPEAPAREGYTFTGWDADFSNIRKDLTVTAQYRFVLSFADVSETDWFCEDVRWAVENGIFQGVGNGLFAPEQALTRGQLVTVLYRMVGSPEPKAEANFRDVAADSYYAKAVAWANENGIVLGMGDGTFDPDSAVTREQMVTIFFRYAKFCGVKTEAGMLDAFRDAASVSDYAREAMGWAVKAGLVKGDGQDLMPKATASRAQAAAILHRFAAVVEK